MRAYIYFVGGLLCENLNPEIAQEKLNRCAEDGWELVRVLRRRKYQDNAIGCITICISASLAETSNEWETGKIYLNQEHQT